MNKGMKAITNKGLGVQTNKFQQDSPCFLAKLFSKFQKRDMFSRSIVELG